MGCGAQETDQVPEAYRHLENLTVFPAEKEAPQKINLEREQSFGDTDETLIGRMGDVTVDDRGRVYIADNQKKRIFVFEPDGQLIAELGRGGQGPGEFVELTAMHATSNELFVFDRNKQESIVFSLASLSYSHTILLAGNRDEIPELEGALLNRYYLIRVDNSFLAQFSAPNTAAGRRDWDKIENRIHIYLLDEDGVIGSGKLFDRTSSYQVLVPLGGRTVGMPVSFFGTLLTALSAHDHLHVAWSEHLLIKRYSPEGEYQDAFYYPIQRAPLKPESEFPRADRELVNEAVRSMDLPEKTPALDGMLFDDENRLWVSTVVDNVDVHEWWVLQDSGELITRFEWPRDEPVEVVKNGYIYTRQTDEETGLQQINRYRFEWN